MEDFNLIFLFSFLFFSFLFFFFTFFLNYFPRVALLPYLYAGFFLVSLSGLPIYNVSPGAATLSPCCTSHIKEICPKPSGQTLMPDKAVRLTIGGDNGYKAFEMCSTA
jgi:hypothetical protein